MLIQTSTYGDFVALVNGLSGPRKIFYTTVGGSSFRLYAFIGDDILFPDHQNVTSQPSSLLTDFPDATSLAGAITLWQAAVSFIP